MLPGFRNRRQRGAFAGGASTGTQGGLDMGMLDGKVAIVTGAGRGIGRAEAMLLAEEGAKVIVNDVGSATTGEGADKSPAEQTVQDIKSAGGEAALNPDDVSSWSGAERL